MEKQITGGRREEVEKQMTGRTRTRIRKGRMQQLEDIVSDHLIRNRFRPVWNLLCPAYPL